MPVVGTITVDLVAGTASFDRKLEEAPNTARRSAKGIQDAFNGMDFGESRGGLILIDEIIGVHMPRHAAAFVSQIPGFAAAFSAMFPIVAVVVAVEAITKAVEAVKKHREEMEKARQEALSNAVAFGQHADALEISNMKLRDQIAILGHKLPQNAVKIAMEEGRQATIKLIEEFQKAIDKETELLGKQEQGFFSKMFFGDNTGDIMDKAKEFKVQIDALASQLAVAKQQGSKQEVEAAQSALDTQLRDYKKFLDDKRAQDEKDRQKQVGDMRSQNKQIESSYTDRMNAAQKAKAAEAYSAQNAQQEADINDKFKQRGAMLNDLTILLNNYSRAQKAQAENSALNTTVANDKDVAQYNEAQIKKMVILEHAIKASSTLIDGQTDRNLKGIEKENAATIKSIDQQLALYDRIAGVQIKIDTLTREISDQQAIQAQKMAVATGHMTEQQAVQQALKTLEKNKADELAEINNRLEAQLAIVQQLDAATNGGTSGTDDQKVQYAKSVAAYKDMESQKLQITKQFNAQLDAERLKQANNEHSQWNKMFLDFSQTQTHMSQVARQTLGQMNSSIAQFVVTGQGNFRQLAASAIESFIQIFLEEEEAEAAAAIKRAIHSLEKKAINAADAQSSAAAGAAATLADVPYPENIPASFQVLGIGEAYAADAMAMRGARLPNREMMIHTHPEELILPQHISNFVVDAASRAAGSGGGGGHTFHVNPVFAPTIQAINAKGVKEMLVEHHKEFHAHLMDELRRMNY